MSIDDVVAQVEAWTAALRRWTGSSIREILHNPKYTGYMVWNRRASKDKTHPGELNPRSDWIWSPHPVHEPLVTRDLFDAAAPVGTVRKDTLTDAVHEFFATRIFGPHRHDHRRADLDRTARDETDQTVRMVSVPPAGLEPALWRF